MMLLLMVNLVSFEEKYCKSVSSGIEPALYCYHCLILFGAKVSLQHLFSIVVDGVLVSLVC